MEHSVQKVLGAMIAYDAGDPKRIHHFLKVHSFARLIGLNEGLDHDTQLLVEIAAIVHDIGIHKAEEIYGCSKGPYQEELGPAEAEKLLSNLGLPEDMIRRVAYLVGHHHTYDQIDGIDYQILVEADFLVNLYEDDITPENQQHAYDTIFQTATGKRLCLELYSGIHP